MELLDSAAALEVVQNQEYPVYCQKACINAWYFTWAVFLHALLFQALSSQLTFHTGSEFGLLIYLSL